jgi:hypothetical protein
MSSIKLFYGHYIRKKQGGQSGNSSSYVTWQGDFQAKIVIKPGFLANFG